MDGLQTLCQLRPGDNQSFPDSVLYPRDGSQFSSSRQTELEVIDDEISETVLLSPSITHSVFHFRLKTYTFVTILFQYRLAILVLSALHRLVDC